MPIANAKGISPVEEDQYHIMLRFLGSQREWRTIAARLENLSANAFPLSLTARRFTSGPARGRDTLWMGLDEEDALHDLKTGSDTLLKPLQDKALIAPEEHAAYHPHISLLMNGAVNVKDVHTAMTRMAPLKGFTFDIDRIDLCESRKIDGRGCYFQKHASHIQGRGGL